MELIERELIEDIGRWKAESERLVDEQNDMEAFKAAFQNWMTAIQKLVLFRSTTGAPQ